MAVTPLAMTRANRPGQPQGPGARVAGNTDPSLQIVIDLDETWWNYPDYLKLHITSANICRLLTKTWNSFPWRGTVSHVENVFVSQCLRIKRRSFGHSANSNRVSPGRCIQIWQNHFAPNRTCVKCFIRTPFSGNCSNHCFHHVWCSQKVPFKWTKNHILEIWMSESHWTVGYPWRLSTQGNATSWPRQTMEKKGIAALCCSFIGKNI